MSAQKDCEFLVKRARELVSEDPCAAKAWLITARTLYPADFTIQVTWRQTSYGGLISLSIKHCLLFLCFLLRVHTKDMCYIFPQYEMYIIERNAERTASAGRLLYDMWVQSELSLWYLCHVIVLLVKSVVIIFPFSRFINFPDQPIVWREISIITGALRSDCQDKHAQFLRGKKSRKTTHTSQHSFNCGVLMCGDVNAWVF